MFPLSIHAKVKIDTITITIGSYLRLSPRAIWLVLLWMVTIIMLVVYMEYIQIQVSLNQKTLGIHTKATPIHGSSYISYSIGFTLKRVNVLCFPSFNFNVATILLLSLARWYRAGGDPDI